MPVQNERKGVVPMSWDLSSDRPVYLQIVEKIQSDIVAGVYKAGDKLPSVRELAAEAAVNPNTMQKALTELEKTGLVYTNRTSGRYISEDKNLLLQMRKDLASKETASFLKKMKLYRYSEEDLFQLIKDLNKDNEEAYT